MSEQSKRVAEIEATQEALRESIEQTKQLAEKAQILLQQHKKSLKREANNSAGETPWS